MSCRCPTVARNYRELERQTCAVCQRCGRAGHARTPPGPLARSGAWCDRCFARMEWNVFPQMVLRAAVVGALLFASVIVFARVVAGVGDVIHDTLTEADEPVSSCAGLLAQ